MDELRVRLGIVEGWAHLLYDEFLGAPREGVTYITDRTRAPGGPQGKRRLATSLSRTAFIRAFSDPLFARALLVGDNAPRGVSYALSRSMMRLAGGKSTADVDRRGFDVFHAAGAGMVENIPWIVENDVRWVVDFEQVASLFGYYGNWRTRMHRKSARKVLSKQLSSRYCRAMLPWTEPARRGLGVPPPYAPDCREDRGAPACSQALACEARGSRAAREGQDTVHRERELQGRVLV